MTPNELLADIEKMDFDWFMDESMERVPEGIDTREGSIIYDALAPAAYNFTELVHQVHSVFIETYTQTATGEFLDYRAAERGLTRKPATYCQAIARLTDENGELYDVDLGTRFASVGVEPIYYQVSKRVSQGIYRLQAEESGNNANRYVGQLLPIDNMNGFGYAEITSVEIPARDEEDDEALRERILTENVFTQYGGNVADYMNILSTLEDVGAGQVYPTWNGGGTVKLVIINNEFNVPTTELIDKVQNLIDPRDEQALGYGMAPIGHYVTVAAPTIKTINFKLNIDVGPDISLTDIGVEVQKIIQDFILDLKKNQWGKLVNERKYSLSIYRSQIMAEILKITGVINVSGLTLNGAEQDVYLKFTNELQELPVVGSVEVNGPIN